MARPIFPLAALALSTACGTQGQTHPKNLLLVCVDTLRADELGTYGRQPSITPALDGLGEESVVFERAHAAASWTLPSIGSVFTSFFPSTTNLWTFESRLGDSFSTLAERFQAAGFDTHGIASHVFFQARYGLVQGFDSFDDELCHRKGEPGWEAITSPVVSAKAVKWLEERAASGTRTPWLLFAHYFDPHIDYLDHEAANPGLSSRPERARYQSEIAFTDRHVGTLLEALARSPFADDTVVLFFSDHGESFGEHPGIERHSYGLYEEELHVPLFLRVPGVGHRHVPDFVRSVDLAPTLLELFGLAPEARGGGVSLVPLFTGGAHEARPQLAEIRLKPGFHANALVRGRYKLVERLPGPRLELYDLERDPRERHDLAAEEPALVTALEGELRASIRAAAEESARFGASPPVEHTPEEIDDLRELGYSGDDESKSTDER
jgi:arylsulfatase A-like enzyme